MKTRPIKSRAAGRGVPARGVHAASRSANASASASAGTPVGRTVKRAKARAPRPPAPVWQLRLYVVDSTLKSQTALANLKQFCETHLKGIYHITVIDLLKQPQLAQGDQILAIPTVVRRLPKPVRTIIGNLSNPEHLLVGLDLRPAI